MTLSELGLAVFRAWGRLELCNAGMVMGVEKKRKHSSHRIIVGELNRKENKMQQEWYQATLDRARELSAMT
jgi:hypothetical protein